MSISQLDPARFRAYEAAIREKLAELPVEFEIWSFSEKKNELLISILYEQNDDSDLTNYGNQFHRYFWTFPVFQCKKDSRGIESPLLSRMTWEDDPSVLTGYFSYIDKKDGECHRVTPKLTIEKLDDKIEDTLVHLRRLFVEWMDHDIVVKKAIAETLLDTNAAEYDEQVKLLEEILPKQIALCLDLSAEATYEGEELFAGKEILVKLDQCGSVINVELITPEEKKETETKDVTHVMLNFQGVSEQRFEEAEPQIVSQLEKELGAEWARASWHTGKTGLLVRLSIASEAYNENEIDQQITEIIRSFDLVDENDPNMIMDEELGMWYWNDTLSCWEADLQLLDEEEGNIVTEFALSIDSDERETDITDRLLAVKLFLEYLFENFLTFHETIADELLETYNQSWNDGEPKSKYEFINEIGIRSLNCDYKGAISCYFSSGELFTDHDIEIRIDPEGNIKTVTLVG